MNSATSLPEVNRTIRVDSSSSFLRKLFIFAGPGYLVSVGYMDPGNWATDIVGGSQYNYLLLSVILISSIMAMFLQRLSLKLGIITGCDLAQLCRLQYGSCLSIYLWIAAEIGIIACDLAEVIGSALALQLLFHIPLLLGVIFTSLDVFLLLILQHYGVRYIESIVVILIITIAGCFCYDIILAQPDILLLLKGFIPSSSIITNPNILFITIGILGATVMPHNLYLHSSLVQTRRYNLDIFGKKEAIFFSSLDSNIALMFALGINSAILILAASSFYKTGHHITDIKESYYLLSPVLGCSGASILFAIALLAAGQNSTFTGTLAGQVVMEGFLNWKISPYIRRLITRSLAIIPSIIIIAIYGDKVINSLLITSQIILSFQLSFAVFPLVSFTSNPSLMQGFLDPYWMRFIAWTMAYCILILNILLIYLQIYQCSIN